MNGSEPGGQERSLPLRVVLKHHPALIHTKANGEGIWHTVTLTLGGLYPMSACHRPCSSASKLPPTNAHPRRQQMMAPTRSPCHPCDRPDRSGLLLFAGSWGVNPGMFFHHLSFKQNKNKIGKKKSKG